MLPVRVSVVIEWDNVRISELDRARRMLAALAGQAAAVRVPPPWASRAEAEFLAAVVQPIEVLVLFDSGAFAEREVRGVVDACLPSGADALAIAFVAVPGARYYDLKNAGAARASGEILVFLDSDAVPEPGWLQGLLAGFADPGRQVIGGNTYLEPVGMYGKTFALTWFFPLRAPDGPPEPAEGFLANNVAFRRSTFLATGFPAEEGLSKGACGRLARRLRDEGIPIHHAPRAHCAHPPPNGARHFVERAIAQGRDEALAPGAPARSLPRAGWLLASHLRAATSRVVRHRRDVGPPAAAVPLGLAIAWSYLGLRFAGEALSHVAPGWMRRHFQL